MALLNPALYLLPHRKGSLICFRPFGMPEFYCRRTVGKYKFNIFLLLLFVLFQSAVVLNLIFPPLLKAMAYLCQLDMNYMHHIFCIKLIESTTCQPASPQCFLSLVNGLETVVQC